MAARQDKKHTRVKRLPRTDMRAAAPRPLSQFARSLLREWKHLRLPAEKARILVGVSGGADSVALFLGLDELIKANKLKLKLHVAHVDHQLRKTAGADARWVRDLAKEFGHDVSISRVDVKGLASKGRDNLEQSARRARYQTFTRLAQKHRAGVVLTAHTMNDQAETILLNLVRGSGADGLGGIEPVRPLSKNSKTQLARPLLSWARRGHTEKYCESLAVEFRRDEMNADESFARVRARLRLLPIMMSINPRVVEALVRTAELLRDDSDALESAAARIVELSAAETGKRTELRLDLIALARPALRRRALRLWLAQHRGGLRRLELVHIRAVENLLAGDRGGRIAELPGGSTVSRARGRLVFAAKPRTMAAPKT